MMIKKELAQRGIIALVAMFIGLAPIQVFAGSWNGWVYQTPYPTSSALLAVEFITPQKGWVSGQHGTILYTGDGGESWNAQESGAEQDLKSISMVNEKIGWIVGNGGVIVRTEDGGKTWQKQGDFTTSFHKVFATNEKECWVGGTEGALLHTDDGGRVWSRQNIGTLYDIAALYFKDVNTGWVLSGGIVYRTTDRGATWEESRLPIKAPQRQSPEIASSFRDAPAEHGWDAGVFFLTGKLGWVVLGLEQIYRTEDGGKTWQVTDLGIPSYAVGRIKFVDEKKGCAVGTSILCTEDGGKTWKERLGIKPGGRDVVDGFLVALWELDFADPSTGWAVGAAGQIFKTSDGGKNWRAVSRGADQAFDFYFLDDKTGWAVRNDRPRKKGYIVKTEDGGASWKVQKEFDSIVFPRYFFINSTTGWAVGHEELHDLYKGPIVLNYFVLHTNDGGRTWATQVKMPGRELRISDDLTDVFFVNSSTGWAVGANGAIFYTKNGGRNWQRQKSGTQANLWRVQFIDEETGFAIGNKVVEGSGTSIILHTADGGKHWKTQWTKKTDWMWLHHLQFIDKKNGYVAGYITEDSGDLILLRTSDGGMTWAEQELEKIHYDQIFFLDKKSGVILTDAGQMLKTLDGGKTWEKRRTSLRRYPWHVSEIFSKK